MGESLAGSALLQLASNIIPIMTGIAPSSRTKAATARTLKSSRGPSLCSFAPSSARFSATNSFTSGKSQKDKTRSKKLKAKSVTVKGERDSMLVVSVNEDGDRTSALSTRGEQDYQEANSAICKVGSARPMHCKKELEETKNLKCKIIREKCFYVSREVNPDRRHIENVVAESSRPMESFREESKEHVYEDPEFFLKEDIDRLVCHQTRIQARSTEARQKPNCVPPKSFNTGIDSQQNERKTAIRKSAPAKPPRNSSCGYIHPPNKEIGNHGNEDTLRSKIQKGVTVAIRDGKLSDSRKTSCRTFDGKSAGFESLVKPELNIGNNIRPAISINKLKTDEKMESIPSCSTQNVYYFGAEMQGSSSSSLRNMIVSRPPDKELRRRNSRSLSPSRPPDEGLRRRNSRSLSPSRPPGTPFQCQKNPSRSTSRPSNEVIKRRNSRSLSPSKPLDNLLRRRNSRSLSPVGPSCMAVRRRESWSLSSSKKWKKEEVGERSKTSSQGRKINITLRAKPEFKMSIRTPLGSVEVSGEGGGGGCSVRECSRYRNHQRVRRSSSSSPVVLHRDMPHPTRTRRRLSHSPTPQLQRC